ncbi:DUF6597 domain-containing transcriptional factor [Fusibacter ferrireducens]|uniref:Helix-turn-helix transcriptional regulator n=1 Tax=Fusibacter ferrireducens TaxID=2785058 RepID=A0ABR9ZVT5_9FIRM|nr:AraC family transcriptional regulator [Fusibacter ferrireducens]MBF4694562.1 helix-turn-helix transcriptional regulator [Fusibacter ferrireducens]
MRVDHVLPPENLEKLIDYVWIVQYSDLPVDKREDLIMPLGHLNIIFNFESLYDMVLDNGSYDKVPNVVVVGQIQSAKKVFYGENVYQIGISILPPAFMLLFNLNCNEITDRTMTGTPELWDLFSALKQELSAEARVRHIYAFLETRFELYLENDQLDTEMMDYIEAHSAEFSVKAMADYFYMSVSTLERQFKKKMGLTPKAYADIIKFSSRIGDAEKLQSHYYDQAHLIKTSQKYTGKTTKQLSETQNELTLKYILEMSRKKDGQS